MLLTVCHVQVNVTSMCKSTLHDTAGGGWVFSELHASVYSCVRLLSAIHVYSHVFMLVKCSVFTICVRIVYVMICIYTHIRVYIVVPMINSAIQTLIQYV